MIHYGDITQLSGYELPIVDVITGGSPCQDLSVAGKRAGLAGERSGLFMEQIRIVKEMRERDRRDNGRSGWLVRPRYMVWENVAGALNSNGGRDFQAVLTEIVRIAEPESPDVPLPCGGGWSYSGCLYSDVGKWSVAWRLHDAQFWGVPQRRKRIALVADFGGLTAPEVLFIRKGLRWDPPESGETPQGAASGVESGARTAGAYSCEAVYDARGNGGGEIVPTITGDHQNRVTDYTAICVGNGQLHNISMAEQANTLDTMHDQQAVLVPEIAHALKAKANLQFREDSETYPMDAAGVVRRLTPLENERLQGMPDDWSKYGVNEKGEVYELSDTARYVLQGNGIARPFWTWLLRRIAAQYERPATLGSLFDGQSSFPLSWQEVGGVPVWCSEIEKNAVAVSKYHFPDEGSD